MKKCEECGYDISFDGAHACKKFQDGTRFVQSDWPLAPPVVEAIPAQALPPPKNRGLYKDMQGTPADLYDADEMTAHGQQQRQEARREVAEPYDEMLRALCCDLAAGGYNSDGIMSPEVANAKIRDGIDELVRVQRERAEKAEAAMAGLKQATPEDEWPEDADYALGHLTGMCMFFAPTDEIGHCVKLIGDVLRARAAIDDVTQEFTLDTIVHGLLHDPDRGPEVWRKELDEYIRVERNCAMAGRAGVADGRAETEAHQRATVRANFASRPPSPATADFDLPAPNDAVADGDLPPLPLGIVTLSQARREIARLQAEAVKMGKS